MFFALLNCDTCSFYLSFLFNNGTIKLPQKQTTEQTQNLITTQAEILLANTITIKVRYISYEGTELDDIGSLEREIKYQDSSKEFTVQDEHADSNFLNKEVLPVLTNYKMKYESGSYSIIRPYFKV